jgi:hypothetical protein
MRVGVQGDGDAGMTQHLRDDFEINVLREQQRGARMPEIVGSGSIIGDKREVVAVHKEPQTNLVHLL